MIDWAEKTLEPRSVLLSIHSPLISHLLIASSIPATVHLMTPFTVSSSPPKSTSHPCRSRPRHSHSHSKSNTLSFSSLSSDLSSSSSLPSSLLSPTVETIPEPSLSNPSSCSHRRHLPAILFTKNINSK